ncbi:MAG: SocA family protein [Methanobrevibacter sp.]|nr:SocA family protein [Methanobrevibacter sp.]
MDFDKEKFKKVLHYLIFKCGKQDNVGKTVLFKLLYFSDFNFFELYETSLTNESYRKLPRGPAPIHFDLALKELINDGKISVKTKILSLGRVKYIYTSLEDPSIDFDEKELNVIDEVINDLGHMNASQISEYSHGDMPWKATEDKQIIDYGFVFYRDPPFEKRQYDESN